jgi:hypothetical protein
MIMLLIGFRRITPQLDNIKIWLIFLIPNIKFFFVIYLYIIHLYHIDCMIFGTRCKWNLKNMPEKVLYQARMTWQFGRISVRHTSQKIYGRNILAFDIWAFHTTVTFQCRNKSRQIHDSVTMHTDSSVPFISHAKRMVRFILIASSFI